MQDWWEGLCSGEGSVIRDITARADGTIVACGVLGESAK